MLMMTRFPKNSLSAIATGRSSTVSRALSSEAASSQSSSDVVIANEISNAGVLTLNRPKALNALNLDMVRLLTSSLKKWETTKSLVIVKSAMDKSFCAGGDVKSLVEEAPENGDTFFREEYTLNHMTGTYRIPYIAFINGITMGGGVGISVHGKYRVATEKTMFAMPETIIGLFPDVGGSHFLPRLEGELGMYLGLTGVRLKGKDVLKAGIATHYCESTKMAELEQALVVCTNETEVNRVLQKFCPVDSAEFIFAKYMKQINECFAADTVEGIVANLQKDNSEWATDTLNILKPMSPLSLKVTHHQIRAGRSLDLAKCFQMEFGMAGRHLRNSDFPEGVRARILEKDNKPKWKYTRIEDVPDEHVKYFFEKLDENQELKL